MTYEKELNELFYMQQVYATLYSLSNKIQIAGDKALGNLSSRQYMAILAILHLPKDQTNLNNIAKKLGSTKQNTRQLITALENKGYVEVAPNPNNRRAVNVMVTPSGFEEMVKSAEAGVLFMADLFREFDGEELRTLWELLKKVYRFDGIEQDGFEAEAPSNAEIADEEKQKVFERFAAKRNERYNQNPMEE